MSKPAAFVSGFVVALVAFTAAGVLFLRGATHGFSARERPTHMEGMLAEHARSAATPTAMRHRVNPVAVSAEALHQGMAHFADHCAICHANNGSGETMLGSGMYPRPPDMRLASTQGKSDGELFGAIENGIRMSGMPAFGGGEGSSEAESWKLVLFLRHLPKLTAAEEQEMEHLNPKNPEELQEDKQEQEFLNGGPQQP